MTNEPESSLPTDIDTLMSLNPLDLTPADRGPYLERVIAYQRQARANREAGIKPKREKGPGVKIDLKALGLVKEQPKTAVGVAGGLRRL